MACETRTTCPYCGVGCGVIARTDDRGVSVKPDPDHPANWGRLCSKGSALDETVDLEGRLLHPQMDGRRVAWDTALDRVAERFSDAIEQHGPDSVAFYVSGQLLTEDYYVANKLMKGFIGSANIDTNSRLCMASSVAGHRRAFGADSVPGTYEDLEQADLIVLVGSNLAWCHPVLFQRIAAAKQARPDMKIVTIDPRRTATNDISDLHLPIRPDGDVALFNGLLHRIADRGALDHGYLRDHVSGFEAALADASGDLEPDIGLDIAELEQFYDWWVRTERVVTIFSQGVNQSASGADKVNAIINCHLATGRIGRPGMGPFSVTGQPNAMGGREVGGLANTLACHLSLEDEAHRAAVRDVWSSPTIASTAGLKAVDLFEACRDGRIKAIWIMATNPLVSMPRADAVREALQACPFVVVSDILDNTDTAAVADVLLPAAGWGEKSGTVTNSERRISRQRAFLPLPGEARPDWRIMCDVAARMGWGDAFAFETPAAVFREHAALSALTRRFGLDFDIAELATLSDAEYDGLAPVQWPLLGGEGPGADGRLFGKGGFYTDDRRARMVPVRQPKPRAGKPHYPYILNSGRVRDHWHTMTRTGKSPRLSQHIAEPFAEIHPKDAARHDIAEADLVRVENDGGQIIVRALLTERVQAGSIFVPMHWAGPWSSQGRVGVVIDAVVDPVSGQPALKSGRVGLSAYRPAWYGFAVSAAKPNLQAEYWALGKTREGWRVEMAGDAMPQDWEIFARSLFDTQDGEAVSMIDRSRGRARIMILLEGRVAGALFTDVRPVAVGRALVISAMANGQADPRLLAGRPGGSMPDPGRTICSCFDVGVNTITQAIQTRNLVDIDEIGAALSAGTNCGSCRPELQSVLDRVAQREAAE